MRKLVWLERKSMIQPILNFVDKIGFPKDQDILTSLAQYPENSPVYEMMYILKNELKKVTSVSDTLASTVITYAMFDCQGSAIFKIANEFGRVLEKVDCKVEWRYLPFDNRIRCIELPDGMEFDLGDGDTSTAVFVGCFHNKSNEVRLTGSENTYSHIIEITAPYRVDEAMKVEKVKKLHGVDISGLPKSVTDVLGFGEDNIRLFLREGETIEQAIEASLKEIKNTGFTRDILSYILKSLLYIHSGEPDLSEFKPTPKPANAKKLKKWRRGNLFEIPVTLVGFNYKKPREYRVGETFVDTFPRWQPYGPKLSKVKLIWVKPHTRTYGKRDK